MRRTLPLRPRQGQGFSLVETMLALAFGLLLVAGIGAWVVEHLGEQRRLLAEARLGQELRAVVDLLARDLRRAGHWGQAERGVWSGDPAAPAPAPNPYRGLYPAAGDSGSAVGHAYSRDAVENDRADANEHFGLRLNPGSGALEWRVAGSAVAPGQGDQWQALTDPAQLRVTALVLRHEAQAIDLLAHCPLPRCDDPDDADCPPRLWLRQVSIWIEAGDPREPGLRRSLGHRLRLRNEELQGACPPG